MADKTTECMNGELKINDIVLVNSIEGRYGCLVGNVIAIDKRGSPDHDTGNPGDDIHVNFADSEYTNWRVLEIEKTFSDNGTRKPLDEIALDDVIMSPEMLINVTHIKHRDFAKILSSFDNAMRFGDVLLRDYFEGLKTDNQADLSDSPHRYMHVDLQDFLGKIAAEIIVYHPKDFDVDMETFREAAACADFIDKWFVWLVSETGTYTPLEFEAFQQGTDPYRYATESHSYSVITPYIVEVTGIDKDGKVIGNVFEAGEYREFANYVKENSVANDMMQFTITTAKKTQYRGKCMTKIPLSTTQCTVIRCRNLGTTLPMNSRI
ncbi:hypothetical protein FACS1894120_1160 [Clostridia bacterium]|nr:hypothetical protein FACS1894120_1160 [Clostridia bacterium]